MAIIKRVSIFLIILLLGAVFAYLYLLNSPKEKNTPKAFTTEVYDKIKDNYWEKISDAKLKDLFKLATEKNGGQVNASNATSIAQAVLASLPPVGRSGLYTQKQEVALKNTVENRNPETGKVEPTIFSKAVGANTLYVQFKKLSPTSLEEFQKAFESQKDNSQLNNLILDLRGNVGGAIDSTAFFLGLFLGKNQTAFEFYHKGEYLPFKTPTDKLASLQKYKQVVILIDQNTQSSAEMMAASMKKYHLGVLLGTPTKGWGSVERVFPLDNQITSVEKYSVFLVHSITLRDDNLPIEGRGVEPDINVKSSDWEQQLFNYFRNPGLTAAVKQVLSNPD